jgi:acetyltransferase-like isoleucine patch superfamily enzyme
LRARSRTRRPLGRASLGLYQLAVRARARVLSQACAGAFAEFGRGSTLQPPVRITGAERIALGSNVFVGTGSWLQVLDDAGGGAIALGDETSISGLCVISSAARVTLGERVLLARNVYIADHGHAFDDDDAAVLDQGIADLAPVEIAAGAWLGQNVVVCPGVRIGRGAVVGANSVVLDDVPDRAVAVGAPARVVRTLAATDSPTARTA